MKPQEMWNAYKQINPSIGDEIDAWAFGVEADLLADLEDKDLTKVFNCVCDSFESYSKGCSEAQLMKRLGYLSAFKNLKKLDIKRPNCWKMLV